MIGSGTPGPLTRRIQGIFFETVHGRNAVFPHWLTPVRIPALAMG
jgi:branched-chain amino acid aminotransferase